MAFVKSHPKITAARAAALPVNERSISISAAGKLITNFQEDLDKRIINGYLATFGNVNDYDEMLIKGAFARSINNSGPGSTGNYKLVFCWQHDITDPLSLYAELVEDDFGLRFRTKPLDPVPNADRTITQIRSGTINQFSYGFRYIWDKVAYDDENDALVLQEVELLEGSVVTIGADQNTHAMRKAGVQMEKELINLNEETEKFIRSIPTKKQQLELRQLLTRYKSLSGINSQESVLENTDPVQEGVYSYLSNILNLK